LWFCAVVVTCAIPLVPGLEATLIVVLAVRFRCCTGAPRVLGHFRHAAHPLIPACIVVIRTAWRVGALLILFHLRLRADPCVEFVLAFRGQLLFHCTLRRRRASAHRVGSED